MQFYLRALLDGAPPTFAAFFGLAIYVAFYVVVIAYPLVRASRESRRMRSICILLGATNGADCVSDTIQGVVGPFPTKDDLDLALSFAGLALVLVVTGIGLVALFAILSRKRWGAIIYLGTTLFGMIAYAAETDQKMMVVKLLDDLGLGLDGAILGLLLLTHGEDGPAPGRVASVF